MKANRVEALPIIKLHRGSDGVRTGGRSRKLTPPEVQIIGIARQCGLSPREALALWACELGTAVAIAREPHRRAELEAEASRSLENVVLAARLRALVTP